MIPDRTRKSIKAVNTAEGMQKASHLSYALSFCEKSL